MIRPIRDHSQAIPIRVIREIRGKKEPRTWTTDCTDDTDDQGTCSDAPDNGAGSSELLSAQSVTERSDVKICREPQPPRGAAIDVGDGLTLSK
jgi:hypothetical protein